MSVRFGFAAMLCFLGCATAQTVRFKTTLGDIDVTLAPEAAPQTVQNFLKYMNRGAYNNSIFHRSVPGFVIQAGGFQWVSGGIQTTAADPPVKNEPAISNTSRPPATSPRNSSTRYSGVSGGNFVASPIRLPRLLSTVLNSRSGPAL